MKFRVYINNSMDGPFGVAELWQLPGFTLEASVCPDGEFSWQPASQYPMITQFSQKANSGDYNPDEVLSDASTKLTSHNWRQAVIGEGSFVPPPSPPTIATSETAKEPLKSAAERFSKTKKIAGILGENRRGILLLLLGFVSVGVYYPETENLSTFISDISTNESSLAIMGSRFHQLGSPHVGGLWKHKTIRLSPSSAPKPAAAVQNAPAPPETIEIGTEDLGNGMVSKTVVVTEIRDGVRVQQTKTIEVPAHSRKAAKRKKAQKSGSAELPGHFPSKIA